MAKVGGEACAGWAEASYEGERPLGEGQAAREVGSGVEGRSEPLPEPSYGAARGKNLSLNLNGGDALR